MKNLMRLALVGLTACLVAGCGNGVSSPDSAAKGDGVPVGATKDQYIAALKDMKPITLEVQPATTPFLVQSIKDYADAVKEWSGGKITMHITENFGIAAPQDSDAALKSGVLGMGIFIPYYDASKYPDFNAWMSADTLALKDPIVGLMAFNFASNEVGMEIPELTKEVDDQGLVMLSPRAFGGPMSMGCSSPKDQMSESKSTQTRISTEGQGTQIGALGMTSVSLPVTEVYTALQRGTVDCLVSGLGNFTSLSWDQFTKQVLLGTDQHAWVDAHTPFGIGKTTWDSLPLAGRQLLYDRQDVMYMTEMKGMLETNAEVFKTMKDAGVDFKFLDGESADNFNKASDDMVDKVKEGSTFADPDGLLSTIQEAHDAWNSIIAENFGTEGVNYDEAADWTTANLDKINYDGVIDEVQKRILDPHRPS